VTRPASGVATRGPGKQRKINRLLDRSMIDRRRFLQISGAALAALGGGLAVTRTAAARATRAGARSAAARSDLRTTPIRPPAVPLIVRSPYLSTWQSSTVSPGTWQTCWNGDITPMAGIVRIDGTSFVFAGDPTVGDTLGALEQTHLALTATRSVFTLQGSGVQITLEYLSPIEPGHLQRQSVPMAWVLVTAQSIDGASHDVSLYLDVTGEWLSGDPSQPFTWAPVSVAHRGGALQAWTMQLTEPQVLTEIDDRAQWGTIILATPQVPGLSYQSGPSGTVRTQFVDQGVLLDTDDTSYTSIGGDGYPAFGFALDLGQVGSQPQTRQFSLGQVRTPLVSYLGTPLQPLWTEYFSDWQQMLAFFHADLAGARQRATALDAKVSADARKAGGAEYEALCLLSLRQAYGATELALGPDHTPWAFLKEISSNGDMSTVDVIFPASPVWIYLDPQYLSLLLRPIFGYAASGQWTEQFAPHDVGIYPTASGWEHVLAEKMPVEESGNMLIMAAAYTRAAPGTTALVYLQANYRWLKLWADYLVATLPNPGRQNQTDDFAGKIAHSVNLALKGIVAVAAMGRIAEACGQHADAVHYRTQARQFIAYWLKHSGARGHSHLGLTYRRKRAWGNTYNAFPDALLGTGLVPESVAAEQAAFYQTKANRLGLPLQTPHRYGKTDWQMWLAAWLHDYPISQELIERVYRYANTTQTRVPFCDLYDTISGDQVFGDQGFRARPVQGGIFALLALRALEGRQA
jgi:Domain of unknown function (DUF5127)/Domain of unknown function (DUF4965)/Domain of unknown function (DUF1793)/Domain of unknown function (DUF4964)